MVKIIPAILTNNPSEVKALLERAENAGVDRVQIDIIDGVFADNKTIVPEALEGVETNLSLDFHLMVKEPINWVEKCVSAGADRIIGHVEHMNSQEDFVGKVQEAGAYVGLAIDLETSVSAINPSIINSLDVILVMSVAAGLGGQEFDPSAIAVIKKLNEIRAKDETPFKIIDDGGVSLENVEKLQKAGVDEVVIGRRLFDGDLKENIDKFMKGSNG